MAYPEEGWTIRCRWEQLLSGRWALTMTVEETDPWIPGPCPSSKMVGIRPELDGDRSWGFPDPRVMEELSRRVDARRVRQIIDCCRSYTESSQLSN